MLININEIVVIVLLQGAIVGLLAYLLKEIYKLKKEMREYDVLV
jgi:hypothetical protein